MSELGAEDGLWIIDDDPAPDDPDALEASTDAGENGDTDLETLRDAFVDAFNARDLDEVLALVTADIECPDIREGDGVEALAEELEAIWERSPGAILTRAHLEREPVAVAWLPDEDGCWTRAAVVCFDTNDGLLSLVELPDDADALERADPEDPTGEELPEWSDWGGWEHGEETVPRTRS